MPLDGLLAAAFREAAERMGRPLTVIEAHRRSMLVRPAAGSTNPREMLSAKRRGEYRRQMLRLADQGAVSIEAVREGAAVAVAFEAFLTLEASGWKGRRGTALLSHKATADFARAAVGGLAERGQARIDTIRVAGKPVAMLVSLSAGTTAYSWKIAYDESFARFSPGAQLMLEAGRAIFADGTASRIDSCAVADHPMVDHLWKDRIAIGTMVVGPPGGGAIHAAGVILARVEAEARKRAHGLKRRSG
jgi:CelD/BcsL family acetyltransferase involved in cellulose biosynthesis